MKKCLILTLTLITLFSCVSSSNRRGSLKEAFDAADNPDEDERRVDDGFTFEPIDKENDYYPDYSNEPDNTPSEAIEFPEPDFTYIGAEFTYINILSKEFSRTLGAGLTIGSNRNGIGLFFDAGLNWSEIKEEETIYKQLNGGLLGFYAGVDLRKNFTDMNKKIYFDLLLEANLSIHPWNYNNSISSVVYDEYGNSREDSITFDSITAFSMGIGPGICLWNKKDLGLFIDPTVGFNLFFPYTSQGFDNDVFKSYIYLKLVFKVLSIDRKED